MTSSERLLDRILKYQQVNQHTAQWYNQRKSSITATDVATILEFNEHKTRLELLREKHQSNHSYESTEATQWGTTFEPIAKELCAERHNRQIHELGLKYHDRIDWLGASPDGIMEHPDGTVSLVEFKCPLFRQITKTIPLIYWIQMQIQMEVWDVDSCLYSEHKFVRIADRDQYQMDTAAIKGYHRDPTVGHLYWKLEEYWDETVYRSKSWFQTVLPELQCFIRIIRGETLRKQPPHNSAKRQRGESEDESSCQELDWQNYTHTQDITNYLLDDTLLDWLNKFQDKCSFAQRDAPVQFSFGKFVIERYQEFRTKLLGHLRTMYRGDFIDIAEDPYLPPTDLPYEILLKYQNRSSRNLTRTKAAIESKIPIIANALVRNDTDRTYGRIDLLVRQDWIEKIFEKCILTSQESTLNKPSGTKRKAISRDNFADQYIIVQIKYSTLDLTADGKHLLNNPKQRIYKGHIALLNHALQCTTGVSQKYALVVGRKSYFRTRGVMMRTDSVFNSVGLVDFSDKDKEYVKIYNESLQWLSRLVREGDTWSQKWADLHTSPPVMELYPNMKNDRDYPWHGVKQQISNNIGELTQCFNIGVAKRRELHRSGIYKWQDLTLSAIQNHKIRQPQILHTLIESNIKGQIQNLSWVKDSHPYLSKSSPIEFYVDFETVSDLQDDMQRFPYVNGTAMIYMVGCYMKNNSTGESYYLNYLVDHLEQRCERNMIRDWIKDMIDILRDSGYKTNKIPLFHWSRAEEHLLSKALEIHGADMLIGYDIEFIDLHQQFRSCYVGIPGIFNYGLKSVAKAMYNLGYIQTVWPEALDGNQAMVAAWRAQEQAKRLGKTLSEVDFMESIIKYNFIDCKVIEELLRVLRSHSPPE